MGRPQSRLPAVYGEHVRAIDTDTELRRLVELAGGAVADDASRFTCGPRDALKVWEAFKELAARDVRDPIVDGDGAERVVGPDPDCDLLLFETSVMEAVHERAIGSAGIIHSRRSCCSRSRASSRSRTRPASTPG